LWNEKEGHLNWVLGQHPVSVLKDNGIAMISRFEVSGSNDRRHGIPEEEVLFMVISQFKNADFPADNGMLESLHEIHRYGWIYLPSSSNGTLPRFL